MRAMSVFRLAAASLVLAVAACNAVEDPSTLSSAVKKQDPCLSATPLALGEAMLSFDVDTSDADNRPEVCGPSGSPIHRVAYYTFTVPSTVPAKRTEWLLYVDTLNAPFDTVVGLLAGGCGERPSACADDACGTLQTQLVEVVEPGTYVLAIGGKDADARGRFEARAQLVQVQHVPAAGLASIEIPRGDFELVGTLSGGNGPTRIGTCGFSAGMAWYWYAACPGDANVLEASTCNAETAFDAALYWVDVDDGQKVCCDELPNEGCVGAGLDQYPGQAEILVNDEPKDVGLHVLEVGGALGTMHIAQGEFHVDGYRR